MALERQVVFTSKYVNEINDKINDGYIAHRYENPWFNGEVGVRKGGLAFKLTPEELEEYAKCKINVQYFARKYCKIKLSDGTVGNMTFKGRQYQKKMLDMIVNHRFTIFMCSRQIGKTISTAIAILHYCIFNSNKNVMLMANKLTTSVEILDKIKEIYKYLPFFLKPGVSSWQARTLIFKDTGCRIMTSARTKEPAIGFTIDFLYLDEFAHIPRNIIESFYRAAYPTVSAIDNSKIVITSTPNGKNLFWRILDAAELPDGDPRKNNFKPYRVYWWQVPGRNTTYIRLNEHKLQEYDLKKENLVKYIQKKYDIEEKDIYLRYNEDNFTWEIRIDNSHDINTEDVRRFVIKSDEFEGAFKDAAEPVEISVNHVGQVTSWKEETIKDIGSEESFNQEYGLQFYAASNLTFTEDVLSRISNQEENFVWHEIPEIEQMSHLEYKELKWIEDRPDIFEWSEMRNYYYALGIDLSEGLGQDFSVINIFRIMPKTEEEVINDRIESVYDFFRLEQVGVYRHNLVSVKQLSEIFYILAFHVLDENKIKVCLEYNTYGAEMLAHLPGLYQGNNTFSSHIFARYKHRADATFAKLGLKIKTNKGILVKEYQNRINRDFVRLHHDHTIREVTTFVKVENPRSNTDKFEAESGHDDCVMSTVGVCTLFNNTGFHDLLDFYIDKELDHDHIHWIQEKLDNLEYPTGVDYNILWSAKKSLNEDKYRQEFANAQIKNVDLTGLNVQRNYPYN
jgi:hypothetical protein